MRHARFAATFCYQRPVRKLTNIAAAEKRLQVTRPTASMWADRGRSSAGNGSAGSHAVP